MDQLLGGVCRRSECDIKQTQPLTGATEQATADAQLTPSELLDTNVATTQPYRKDTVH
jgi:hypothetical protein